MSNQADSGGASIREREEVLGYLLKHAHLSLESSTDAALGRFGITSRDLGVLRVIAGGEAKSQQDVAGILGVDRTSMVALLDALEQAGIVARRPSEQDRRRKRHRTHATRPEDTRSGGAGIAGPRKRLCRRSRGRGCRRPPSSTEVPFLVHVALTADSVGAGET